MPHIPANLGRLEVLLLDGWFTFRPNGPVTIAAIGPRRNPLVPTGDTESIHGARLIVGLAVGGVPTWEDNDVIKIVKRVRLAQLRRHGTYRSGATVISQRGLYLTDKLEEDERSVQVVILNTVAGVAQKEFHKEMIELGEELCLQLKQDSVLYERQRDGRTVRVWLIVPPNE